MFTIVVTPPQQTLSPETVVVVSIVLVVVLVVVLVIFISEPPGRVVRLVTVMRGPGKTSVFSIVIVTVADGRQGNCTVEVTVAIEQPEEVLEVLDAHSLQPTP